jgi:hypothetical protein
METSKIYKQFIKHEYIYRVYNHNETLLGEFKTKKEANDEKDVYTHVTGNDAYIEKFRKRIKIEINLPI